MSRKSKPVFTYHDSLPGSNPLHATKLLMLWRRNWSAQGFDPIVLNENHARQHPLYEAFSKRINELPTVNIRAYENACFLRWLAMAQVGGGIMTDADVFIYSIPKELEKGAPAKLLSLQGHVPSCVIGSKAAYEMVVKDIMDYQVSEVDIEEGSGRPHVSDMYMFYRRGITYVAHHVVKNHGDEGWAEAPLVHFSNSSMKDLHPRYITIPKLRNF